MLSFDLKEGIIAILQEFKDYFAWNYDKMLGFDKSLVEHRLPIISEFPLEMGNGLARPILAQPTWAAGQNGLGHFGPFFSGHFLVSPTRPYMGCGLKRVKTG